MKKINNPNYFHASDGVRIFYKTNFSNNEFDNKKILLVFNYGLVCNFEHWQKQIPFFDNLGFQILIHDYRCHFNSSGKENLSSCDFPQMTNDLNELLNSLNATKIIMIGHSMGVNVTLEYAANFPKNLLSMILISGSILPPQDIMFDSNIIGIVSPYIKTFSQKYPDFYKKFWENNFLNPIFRKIVHNGGFNIEKVPEEFVHTYMKKIGELPPEIFLHLLEKMKDHDIFNRLSSMNIPALIVGGDRDKVIPNYLQTILANQLPLSKIYIVKDGSHVPQVDFPESLNERFLSFIQS